MNDIFNQDIEDIIFNSRKEKKQERKIASSTDRSKYKKTDQQKIEKKKIEIEKQTSQKLKNLPEGRVLAIISQGIIIESKNILYSCTLRGHLKKEKQLKKNLITVGDFVLFEKISNEEGVIHQIKRRKSTLSRADNLSRNKEQLIAANIDQVFITASVVTPKLKPPLIDRYIIASLAGNITPIVLINKIDLLKNNPEEKDLYKKFLLAYKNKGIQIISVSALTKKGISSIKKLMKDKTSAFTGQSGTGKTAIINVITKLNRRTGKTVAKTKKGAHTTTMAELLTLKSGGFCVDTPGIQSFGLWNIQSSDIKNYFIEIKEISTFCKYPNCKHINEPNCAVKKAVQEGKISQMRFNSYITLIKSINEKHQPR